MKKIEYVIQKYVGSWSDLIVYSTDEFQHASKNFRDYTDNYKKAKFRFIMRTTLVTEENVFQETF